MTAQVGLGAMAPGRFVRDRSGSVSMLILPMFLFLIFATGIAIDLARHEAERADLQNALDRCVLAAASLSQTVAPQTICNEYVASRSFNATPVMPRVVAPAQQGGQRVVGADATFAMDTTFLGIPAVFGVMGLDTLTVSGAAAAQEADNEIEISLVLDISGSMSSEDTIGVDGVTTQRRLAVLRDAASLFVDATLGNPGQENTSISLIPFAGQVNAGPFFDTYLAGGRLHNHSSCIDFQDDDFTDFAGAGTVGLPEAGSRSQTPHFQHFVYERLRRQTQVPIDPQGGNEADWGWCPSDEQAILPFTNDPVELKTRISRFIAHDGTGTQNGMKWGLALLDRATQPLIRALVDDGVVAPAFADRPGPFGENGPQKVIVVMTDGRIRYQIRPTAEDYHNDPDYFAFDQNELFRCRLPDGAALCSLNTTSALGRSRSTINTGNRWDDARLEEQDEALRSQQFQALCQAAEDVGVRVFTIAFGFGNDPRSTTEKSVLQGCASAPVDFFDARNGVQLQAAFEQIRSEVQKLKLFR